MPTRRLRRGNRVRIIHSVGRDLNELIQAVSKWLPVYMTGMIEPYYYPKLRDGIFQRTMFIAPKTAAIVSSSVTKKTDGMLNELMTDSNAVSALAKEYENYFLLCRPLMHIVNASNAEDLWRAWNTLAKADGACICMSGMPSLATLPKHMAEAMQKRAPESHIVAIQKVMTDSLLLALEHPYTEIIRECTEISGEKQLPCGEFLGAPGLCYTDDEYREHSLNIHRITEESKNYKVIPQKEIPQNLLLFCKEEHGVILVKTDAPCAAFVISEPNMTNAFWDYLSAKSASVR